MKVTLGEVKAGYAAMKKLAFDEFNKGNYEITLSLVDYCATLASQIMWRYADDELEELLRAVGNKIIKKAKTFSAQSEKVVFYDFFASPVILTLQYIRVLIKLDYEILYLYEERSNAKAPVLNFLETEQKVTIEKINLNPKRADRLIDIYQKIVDFQASKLFIHINTLSVAIPVFFCLPKDIIRYYINLGDHAFWLGSKAIDFSFEFRNFGANVSLLKRGLKREQLFLLPYYPIIDNRKFHGFPEEAKNKVVIFSGGDFYKTVDKNKTYWNLVAKILKKYPQTVILFANKALNAEGQILLDNFITENGLQYKFIPIGFRSDINEVMKHCDIYMGTCPMSGGLMSQHAAINARPVLQYYPEDLFSFEETESMICYKHKLNISYTNEHLFLEEAGKLISDKLYREKKGKKLQECMISENEFNQLFSKTLETHKTQIEIENVEIKFDKIEKWWIEVNNESYYDAASFIYLVLGKFGFRFVPRIFLFFEIKRILLLFKNKILNKKQ